jgi:hypothetical protein
LAAWAVFCGGNRLDALVELGWSSLVPGPPCRSRGRRIQWQLALALEARDTDASEQVMLTAQPAEVMPSVFTSA